MMEAFALGLLKLQCNFFRAAAKLLYKQPRIGWKILNQFQLLLTLEFGSPSLKAVQFQ